MKCTELKIENFKGLRNFSIEMPKGESITILGDNATGKTTVGDSLTWLLFDKDLAGRSAGSFGIKTRNVSGDVIHNLDHSVEGAFDNGMKLKKVHREKWGNDKGSTEKVLKTHTTNHYVGDEDGLFKEVSKEKYNQVIASVMDEQTFKILSVPGYFLSQMHWKDRRPVLKQMAGEISMKQVVESDERIKGIMGVLNGMNIPTRESDLKDERRKLKDRVASIPDSIMELRRQIDDAATAQSDVSIDSLKKKRKELEGKLAEHNLGGGVHELTQKKHELESELARMSKEYDASIDEKMSKFRGRINEAQKVVDELLNLRRQLTINENELFANLKMAQQNLSVYVDSLKKVHESKPPQAESGDCPYCGAKMEGHDPEKAKKEIKKYNVDRVSSIKELEGKIDEQKKLIGSVESSIKDNKKELEKVNADLKKAQSELEGLQEKYESGKQAHPAFDTKNEYHVMAEKIAKIDDKIEQFNESKKEVADRLNEQIEAVDEQIGEIQKSQAIVEQVDKSKSRIAELEDELKSARSELDDINHALHLIETYRIVEGEFITAKVNEKFDKVSWKLFDVQMNGNISETCEAVYDGVPYSEGLNSGHKIHAGLEVISVLSDHFGNSAPVIVDNAESVTDLPKPKNIQLIRLVVDKKNKSLKVEK